MGGLLLGFVESGLYKEQELEHEHYQEYGEEQDLTCFASWQSFRGFSTSSIKVHSDILTRWGSPVDSGPTPNNSTNQ